MESYELDQDKIITWGIQYASYEELERTAKALYGVYVDRRKKEQPDLHKANKKAKKKYKGSR